MNCMVEVTLFWDVTLHSVVGMYQCFNGTCCFHLQNRRWDQLVTLKCQYCLPDYAVATQKMLIITVTAMKTLNLTHVGPFLNS
jgi:hypothetical protein